MARIKDNNLQPLPLKSLKNNNLILKELVNSAVNYILKIGSDKHNDLMAQTNIMRLYRLQMMIHKRNEQIETK